MRIEKIGGTSLGTAERLHTSLDAALAVPSRRRVLVVSAPAGITDALIAATEDPARDAGGRLAPVRARCQRLLEEAVPAGDTRRRAERELARAFRAGAKALVAGKSAIVLATGERASLAIVGAALVARGLAPRLVDASRVIRLDADGRPDPPRMRQAARVALDGAELAVVPGFFGAGPGGRIRVLGRGASDLSATLLGAALDAELVTIWTDTAGVWSADPRLIASAQPIAALTWAEARRLAVAGARVLHPEVVEPVCRRGIPVLVADPRHPSGPVTCMGSGARGLAAGPGMVLVVDSVDDGWAVSVILPDGLAEWPAAAGVVAAARALGLARPLGVRVGQGRVDLVLRGGDLRAVVALHDQLVPGSRFPIPASSDPRPPIPDPRNRHSPGGPGSCSSASR